MGQWGIGVLGSADFVCSPSVSFVKSFSDTAVEFHWGCIPPSICRIHWGAGSGSCDLIIVCCLWAGGRVSDGKRSSLSVVAVG